MFSKEKSRRAIEQLNEPNFEQIKRGYAIIELKVEGKTNKKALTCRQENDERDKKLEGMRGSYKDQEERTESLGINYGTRQGKVRKGN